MSDNQNLVHCTEVITQSQILTDQVAVVPEVIPCGNIVVKIPVVLSEAKITIPVEAVIKLDQEAIEIKRIKKNVYLNQSRIVKVYPNNTGILFIAGFIRENIEYATRTCGNCGNSNICGDIRHCTVDVPFSYSTKVTFLRRPIFKTNSESHELRFFEEGKDKCNACGDSVIGGDFCDRMSSFTEVFNERPFTELIEADITEIDINRVNYCKGDMKNSFTQITEKVVVDLTVKILQKQQVKILSQG